MITAQNSITTLQTASKNRNICQGPNSTRPSKIIRYLKSRESKRSTIRGLDTGNKPPKRDINGSDNHCASGILCRSHRNSIIPQNPRCQNRTEESAFFSVYDILYLCSFFPSHTHTADDRKTNRTHCVESARVKNAPIQKEILM